MPVKSCAAVACVLAMVFGFAQSLSACAQPRNESVFTGNRTPDLPLEQFAAGKIGILQPTYARSFLVVAYRYLAGRGLDPDERAAVLELWKVRLRSQYRRWNDPEPAMSQWLKAAPEVKPEEEAIASAVEEWHEALGEVKADAAKQERVEPYKEEALTFAVNQTCFSDAFSTAAKTLHDLIGRFGAQSPQVLGWSEAQEQVFSNCVGAANTPEPLPPGTDPLLAAHRNYQIAAAHLYCRKYEKAEAEFREIAKDAKSPWKDIAPYLVARTLVHEGPLKRAQEELLLVLDDPALAASHDSAREMLNYVRYRLDPEARRHELAVSLPAPGHGKGMRGDLGDYTWILDRFAGEDTDDLGTVHESVLGKLDKEEDLTDWVLTFQVEGQRALDHALQRYEKTGSLPWLLAALSKIAPNHPKTPRLLEEASKIDPESPAYLLGRFHGFRCLAARGKGEEARRGLHSLLADASRSAPRSSLNQFLALRMKLAVSMDEFLAYAPRIPSSVTDDEHLTTATPAELADSPRDEKRKQVFETLSEGTPLLDTDSALVFNKFLPLNLLIEALRKGSLPDNVRLELARAAWVRSILLEDDARGQEVARELQALDPLLKEPLGSYLEAGDVQTRRFLASYTILRSPGLRPFAAVGLGRLTPVDRMDTYGENWWCSFKPESNANATDYYQLSNQLSPSLQTIYPEGFCAPGFLSRQERAQAKAEWNRLVSAGSAPTLLCRQVVSFAKAFPKHPLAAEALHLAVRSTRYGCGDADNSSSSRSAFELLHHHYPGSEWAKKTPYYY
jgi:hypothetical protein